MSQYSKTYGSGGWQNDPATATPESAAAFNNIEQGIATRVGSINGVDPDATGNVVVATGGGAVSSVAGRTGAVTLTSADVGLGSVNNTTDAAKPVSTATNTALAAKADLVSGTVPTAQLATGTANNTTFHRGDGTWAVPAGGGSGPIANTWTTSFTVDSGNADHDYIILNGSAGNYLKTITRNTRWALMDGVGNEYYQVALLVIQDLTGNRISTFPGGFAWVGAAVDSFGQPTLNMNPGTLTLIRFTWMGLGNGYLAEV